VLWGQVTLYGVDVGYPLYLLVAFCTHAAVGYALVLVLTDARPAVGAVAGLAPDADFLFLSPGLEFPFVHRGITHTPLVLAAGLLAAAALDADADLLAAVGVAYLSHLVLDSLTPSGVMWFYPVSTASLGGSFGGHSPAVTLVLWTACAAVYARWRGLPDDGLVELLAEDQEQPDAD